MPLSMIIDAQLRNPYGCPVLTLSMGGASITASSTGDSYTGQDEAQLLCSGTPVTVEEATGGEFRLMFVHPEACVTDFGQRILRILNDKEAIQGLIVDEIHQVGKISCLIYLA